jgi:hypothetical protein
MAVSSYSVRNSSGQDVAGAVAWSTWYPGQTATATVRIYNDGDATATKLWLALLLTDGSTDGADILGDYVSDERLVEARLAGTSDPWVAIGGGVEGDMLEIAAPPAAGAYAEISLRCQVPADVPYGMHGHQVRAVALE